MQNRQNELFHSILHKDANLVGYQVIYVQSTIKNLGLSGLRFYIMYGQCLDNYSKKKESYLNAVDLVKRMIVPIMYYFNKWPNSSLDLEVWQKSFRLL